MGEMSRPGYLSALTGSVTSLRGGLGVLVALAVVALCASPALAKAPSDRTLVDVYAALEGAHVGEVLPGGPEHFITVTDSPKHSEIEHVYGKTYHSAAHTTCAWDSSGVEAIGCEITIFGAAHGHGDSYLRATIAHEVFHVFEARMSHSSADFESDPGWLLEGAATWVESDLVANDPSARGVWKEYLRSPAVPLFSRIEDAVGFFGHMASNHISPWTRFKKMFEVKGSPAAWAAGVAGNTAFLNSEAAAFFREPHLGSEWDAQGPNVPSSKEVGFKPTAVSVTKSSPPRTLTVKPYADGAYDLSISGLSAFEPVVEVTVSSGHLRVHSTSGGKVNEVVASQLLLCSDPKGCSCPSRPSHFEEFQRGDLAITGGPTGGSVKLVKRKPCEVLLPPVSCLTLLPGFGPLITSVGGKSTAVETRRPDGTSDSACAFLVKGEEIAGAEGEGPTFRGVTAPVVNVLRSSSIGGAITIYKLMSIAIPGFVVSHPKIGDEAVLLTRSGADATGQVEFGSSAVVRVHNIVVNYALYGTPGNTEADPEESLRLLARVASKL
ncbi:MAG TPA: hypothetical protein VES65_10380 [Solirubrobacteraceae bacterium]|nr:hypothetical protein [Solirubrobacteraceae bacterium]